MIKELENKFLNIIQKHNNPIWAREELEWLVYDKHRCLYDNLSCTEKFEVDVYFSSLNKIHGGN